MHRLSTRPTVQVRQWFAVTAGRRPAGALNAASRASILLVVCLGLASGAEYLVSLPPRSLQLPPGLTVALAPVWPQPGPVLLAILLFCLAAAAFVAATRLSGASAESTCPTAALSVERNPTGNPSRGTLLVLGGGFVLWTWVIVRLASNPTDFSLPGLFLLAVGAIVASFAYHERRLLRPHL